MAIDESNAFEAENGIQISDNNNVGPFITGGSASPVGLDLSVNTIYVQNNGSKPIIWQKYGALVSEWRIYAAEDIGFDVSGLTADSSDLTGLTQTQEVVEAVANRHFGKVYMYNDLATFSTISPIPVVALSLSTAAPAGTYRLLGSFTTTNSKSNTSNFTEIDFDGTLVASRTQPGLSVADVFALRGDLIHPGGTLTAEIITNRTAGNGTVELSDMVLDIWRIA